MAKWSLLGLAALGRAVAFFALWMLLVDGTDEPNLVAGGVCAIAAAALATVANSLRSEHARLRPSMVRRAYRPFLLLITDTGRVIRALLERLLLRRAVTGTFRAVRYRATSDAQDEVARRALTQWASAVGANRYAIGIDRRHKVLIVHELVRSRGPLDPLELG